MVPYRSNYFADKSAKLLSKNVATLFYIHEKYIIKCRPQPVDRRIPIVDRIYTHGNELESVNETKSTKVLNFLTFPMLRIFVSCQGQ